MSDIEPTMCEIMRAFDDLPRDARGAIKDRAENARDAVDGPAKRGAWEDALRAGVLQWCADNPDDSPLNKARPPAPVPPGPYEEAVSDALRAVQKAIAAAKQCGRNGHADSLTVAEGFVERVLRNTQNPDP